MPPYAQKIPVPGLGDGLSSHHSMRNHDKDGKLNAIRQAGSLVMFVWTRKDADTVMGRLAVLVVSTPKPHSDPRHAVAVQSSKV